MPMISQYVEIKGIIGHCGSREVFLAFAPAKLLCNASFAEVLDEDTGLGYQRPINAPHSMEFRRYIQQPGATTIPLTLNLREDMAFAWHLEKSPNGTATLKFDLRAKVFAQVDCQHRLGYLTDLDTPLAIMSFIGMSVEEERQVFTTINSKAKGLSGSLLDFNVSRLTSDPSNISGDLLIAARLADDRDSPWFGRLKQGGKTLGLKKPASLRMMRHGVAQFLRESKGHGLTLEAIVETLKRFWRAIALVYPQAWEDPRHHYLTKGVGIYSLMRLAGQLVAKAASSGKELTEAEFASVLSDRLADLDWRHGGPLESFNGEKGADQAFRFLVQKFGDQRVARQ